jgi:predicted nicotinamide N-methyase
VTDYTKEFIHRETLVTTAPLVPELMLHLATQVLPLWQMTEAEMAAKDLPPPYWAFAWPGGQALARYILDTPDLVAGKSVIDFGSGCGIGALAAARMGATQVSAAEIDRFAQCAIGLNAAINGVTLTIAADPKLLDRPCPAQSALIGDMCYERPLAEAVMRWARAAAADGVLVLLGDPGRSYRPVDRLEELARYDVPTDLDLEDSTSRETVVWRVV